MAVIALLTSFVPLTLASTGIAGSGATVVRDEPLDGPPTDGGERVAALRRELVARIDAIRKDADLPGLVVAVVLDDEPVLVGGFGVSDVAEQTPIDEATLVRMGPIAETMISVLAAMTVDAGRIRFSAPVIDGMPRIRLRTGEESRRTTLQMLLGHRAGIRLDERLWSAAPDADAALGALADCVLEGSESVQPTAMNAFAAAVLLGAATASDPMTLLHERLLDPLKMTSTGSAGVVAAAPLRRGVGHRRVDVNTVIPVATELDHGSALLPVRGMWTRATDLVPYLRLLAAGGRLGDDRLVSQERLQQTWWMRDAELLSDLSDRHMSMGWITEPRHGVQVVGRSGSEAGFASTIVVVPAARLAMAAIAVVDDTMAIDAIADAVVAAVLLGGEADSTVVDEFLEQPLAGDYVLEPGSARVRIRTFGGSAAIDLPGAGRVGLLPPDDAGRRRGVAGDMVIVGPEAAGGAQDGPGRSLMLWRHALPTVIARNDDPIRSVGEAAARMRVGELLNVYVDDVGEQRIEIGLGAGGGPMMVVGGQVPVSFVVAGPDTARDEAIRVDWDRWRIPGMRNVAMQIERGVDGRLTSIRLGSDAASVRLRPEMPVADEDPRRAAAALLAGADRPRPNDTVRLRGVLRAPSQGVHATIGVSHRPGGIDVELDFGPLGRIAASIAHEPGQRPHASVRGSAGALDELLLRHVLDASLILTRGSIADSSADALLLGQSDLFGLPAARILVNLAGVGGDDDLRAVVHMALDGGLPVAIELPDAGPLLVRPTRVEPIGGVPTVLAAEFIHPTLGVMTLTLEP